MRRFCKFDFTESGGVFRIMPVLCRLHKSCVVPANDPLSLFSLSLLSLSLSLSLSLFLSQDCRPSPPGKRYAPPPGETSAARASSTRRCCPRRGSCCGIFTARTTAGWPGCCDPTAFCGRMSPRPDRCHHRRPAWAHPRTSGEQITLVYRPKPVHIGFLLARLHDFWVRLSYERSRLSRSCFVWCIENTRWCELRRKAIWRGNCSCVLLVSEAGFHCYWDVRNYVAMEKCSSRMLQTSTSVCTAQACLDSCASHIL